jgi:hypothetical protein
VDNFPKLSEMNPATKHFQAMERIISDSYPMVQMEDIVDLDSILPSTSHKLSGSISVRWLAKIIKLNYNMNVKPRYGDLLTALYNRLTMLTEGIGHIEENFVLLLKKSE